MASRMEGRKYPGVGKKFIPRLATFAEWEIPVIHTVRMRATISALPIA
ncbi:MAG: hypothetical protein ACRD5R_05080 [Candidatus Acidiferrales bacterium]